jgi:hypothetical protein
MTTLKLKPVCIADKDVKWCSSGKSMVLPQGLNVELSLNPEIPLLSICQNNEKLRHQLGIVADIRNSSSWKAEAGGFKIQG